MRNLDFWKTEREKAENIDGLLLVLREETEKGPTLKMWKPKATNPFSNYYYRNLEQREKAVSDALDNARSHKQMIAERKVNRKGTPELIDSVKTGAIFHFSWGYEQTNVDFYQVIGKKGKMLTLREIGQKSTNTETGNSMADYRLPTKNQFLIDSKPFTKKLQFSDQIPYITMASYGWCSLWDGKEKYCSWYA